MRLRFGRCARGNVSIMMALAIIPLGLAAGVAIDMSRASYVRTVLQGAADAAALAGATSKKKGKAALQKIVRDYLDANHSGEVLQHVSKIEQKLDTASGTFTVSIDGEMQTSFMAMAGFDTLDIGANSVVNVGSQALELALVLDNTGSMAGTKIANLKTSANTLVDIIRAEKSDYADVKLAVVPFAEYVNVGISNGSASWIDTSTLGGLPFSGCVGSRKAPKDVQAGANGQRYPALATGVPCNGELLPLTTDFDAVKGRINAMVSTGATYIPTGLMWGWNALDSAAPFTEGRTKAELKRVNGRKAIVLMTDGENTISPAYPFHNGSDTATSNSTLTSMCGKVKSDNIEIFTISFMVPSQAIKDILVGCATEPTKYFDADNSAELNAAFTQIARDLAAVRFTQ